MMNVLNRLILFFTPLLPKSMVHFIAGRYVAGETVETAVRVVKTLNQKGFSATLDILGEHVKTREKSRLVTQEYSQLYDVIRQQNLDCNISVKPTHLGLEIDESLFLDNIFALLDKAREIGNFLRIDMENSPYTDKTISAYLKCFEKYEGVGTVFQAYLYRTEKDVAGLFHPKFNFRLCKGIYKEDPSIAIQDRKAINDNYLKILRLAFENEAYVGIATHDLDLLEQVYRLIDEMNVPSDRFEFQVLYGVPMKGWLEKHLEKGYKVRVYVPFGPDWYDYSIRRLKENTNIVGYILGNFFRKK